MDKHVVDEQLWIQMPGTHMEQSLLLRYFRSLDLSLKRKTYSVSMNKQKHQHPGQKNQNPGKHKAAYTL